MSNTYTETLGDWPLHFFLAGAVAILYSSVFGGAAASARVFADFVALLGAYDSGDYRRRRRAIQLFTGIVLVVPVIYYMALPELVLLVKIGGIAQALMLPIIGFSVLYLCYHHLPKSIAPKGWITLALWTMSVVTAIMMGYSVLQQLLIPAEYSVVFGHSKCLARAGAARCAPTLYFANINRVTCILKARVSTISGRDMAQ